MAHLGRWTVTLAFKPFPFFFRRRLSIWPVPLQYFCVCSYN